MKPLLVLTIVLAVSACSTQPSVVSKYKGQYCYTEKVITVDSGDSVSSETNVICSDTPNKTLVYTGIAEQCSKGIHTVNQGQGRQKLMTSTVCKIEDGISDYQIVPNY